MHTVHLAHEAINDVKYAAMGIFFSVDDSTITLDDDQEKIIEDFFASLKWDTTSGDFKAAEVPYGNLMMMVDMSNRWVYKGSVTTPPCDTYVYWNVLTTVYPIKQATLDNFKKQLARTSGLESTGNYRLIQKLDKQDPIIIKTVEKTTENTVFVVLMIVFIVTAVLFCVVAAYFKSKVKV